MRLKRGARLGGVHFTDWPVDHHGDWAVLDADGIGALWGGVDVRREDIARPSAHGSFDLRGFLAPRVIPLSGHLSSRSREGLEHFAARVGGLLADGSSSRLVVEGPDGSRWCDVRLGAATQVRLVDATTARFQIQLWSPDPRLYGEVHDFTSGQTAYHRGNFPARPQLIVSGTASGGYTVTGPGGRRVVVTKALTSGAPHTIDFARGGLWINGVRQLRAITVYEPWEIAPGLPGAVATVNNGASLIQRVTDTFV